MLLACRTAARLGQDVAIMTHIVRNNRIKILARVTGLEPATSGVTGRRSNQLSYTREAVSGRLIVLWVSVKRMTAR